MLEHICIFKTISIYISVYLLKTKSPSKSSKYVTGKNGKITNLVHEDKELIL